jgi:hypothetical protein
MQDDRPKPNWLEAMLSVADCYPKVQALWATEDIIDAQGILTREGRDTGRLELIQPGRLPWYSILQRGCIWQISGSLTRSELFRNIPFNPRLPHCGDYDWLLRAIRVSAFVYYERPLIELRLHAGQASAGNLASGKDIAESHSVVKSNLAAYPRDLTLLAGIALSLARARVILIRVAAALIHRRFGLALRLSPFVVRFAFIFVMPASTNLRKCK